MKNDRQLQEDILNELDWEPSVETSRIGVEVSGGVATLSGHVDSYSQKWAAERAAQRVAGIKSIAVELDVVLPGPHQRSDTEIAWAAAQAIDWNASIPKDTVKLVVENGWVTLSGEVEWAFVRNAAEASVRNLYGVKGVVNKIIMRPRIEPRGVKTKIEAALYRRAHFDATAITVGVEEGTVTLTGEVDSLAERSAVEWAAWSAPGVQNVIDHLVVA
ncbi:MULTISPECIES: BON domain-containing protein [unclassified Rhodanobacter]|uniref:BON domain-containing protein n=1 Tax=unclassified Rhodanobacter TaxID=2621553 RepID=UPI000986A226|nr:MULTISPECIES: BON domain-containing protein [unclassified Rhodanobacter]OOG38575.1 OsmY domain-containing protein [Rhodanobacter sp. C05]OOG50086.1 OsmY domain-containing protein [Rhodanobacter sp. C01]OOG52274.1 OsmY domain-containing protein [Rhodanobacter sp. C03]